MEANDFPSQRSAETGEDHTVDSRSAAIDPLASADADLDALESAPVDEQPAIYARIHSALTSALAGTDVDGVAASAQHPGG